MGFDYSIQDSGGNRSGEYQLNVYVYPDQTDDTDVCQNQVIPGLTDACEQAYNNSSVIDYWEVAYTEDLTSEDEIWTSSMDRRDARRAFEDRYDNEQAKINGSHMLVNEDRSGGVADGGDILCQNEKAAWFDWSTAVYGTDGDPSDYIRNVAIQEAFHNFIDICIGSVNDAADGEEHALGQVYQNLYGDTSSPMITSYEDDDRQKGDCQSNAGWDGGYTTTLTSCTVSALDDTAVQHNPNN